MRKYLLPICFPVLFVLIISVVFLLAPTAQVVSHAGELEDAKEEVRKNPDDANAHYNLGKTYHDSGRYEEAIEAFKHGRRCSG
jgi:cytochrome c-type biogenesis protein CcmH/NrfG